MPHDDERLDRLARLIEASTAGGASITAMDLDAQRAALGSDFAELEALVEVVRVLEAYMEPQSAARLRNLACFLSTAVSDKPRVRTMLSSDAPSHERAEEAGDLPGWRAVPEDPTNG